MMTVSLLLPLLTGGSIVLIQSLHPAKAMLEEILVNRGSVLPAMAQVFRLLAGLPRTGASPPPVHQRRGSAARRNPAPSMSGTQPRH